MNRTVALILQAVVVLVGLAALVFLLGEPHLEGRNAQATVFEVYFKDPFLAYVYVGSIAFFIALGRAFGLLGHVRRDGVFPPAAADSLRAIKRCALVMLAFVAGAAVIIVSFGDGEDRPAGVFMCLLAASVAGTIAASARALERKLRPRPA